MDMTESYRQLKDELGQLRRQWRLQKLIEGLLLTLAGVAVVLVVAIAADNLLKPATTGRLLMAFALWGTLAAGVLVLVLRRWWEDRRDDFFAAMVEQNHPELQNQLINALQLGRDNHYGSPRLVEAIVHDAAHATADLEMTDSVDRKPVKLAVSFAVAAMVLIAAYAIVVPPRFANGLARVLMPTGDIPPYTATQIVEESVRPGDTRVPEGTSVTVTAGVSGVIPAEARLLRRSGGNRWRAAVMRPDKTAFGTFRYTVLEADESFDYTITAGDGRSRQFHVEVVERPRVENITPAYSFPAYTALSMREVSESDGRIDGPVGTKVTVEVKATKPLRQASLVAERDEIIELAKAGDDRTWRGSFVIWSRDAKLGDGISGHFVRAPTRYRVKLVDADGYENADPLWRSITVTKDQAPSIAFSTPGRDLQVKPDEVVKLAVEAKDDYGIDQVRIVYRVNDEQAVRQLAEFPHDGQPKLETSDKIDWNLAEAGLKRGNMVRYWATATDRNNVTGPGKTESRQFSIFIVTPELAVAKLELQLADYAQVLEELVRLQRENRAQTASSVAFRTLVIRQTLIRTKTGQLARAMQKGAFPATTMIATLNGLYTNAMADAIRLFEAGQATKDLAKASNLRNQSLPVQDEIIKDLQALLARLQRNEQARKELRKLAKSDKATHKPIADVLSRMIEDLGRMMIDRTELAGKFEKLPKRPVEELNEESFEALKDLDEFLAKWGKWAKGTVDGLTKLPTGFVDDFNLRTDVNTIFEEIEKAASRAKAQKIEVALEDSGASLATEMLEDLEMWMLDAPDSLQWIMEEPLDAGPMEIPEMPLPDSLQDMIGDLLQEADEFDMEAEDITSAWGDSLNQAGWAVMDGPISNFSAKGVTGNDLPNAHELSGRAGDGRRGRSSGQMVGDTARGLEGRKTPARLSAERYEPGQLKVEGWLDPAGATGGGKKAGAGRKGLQGGTPPDFVRDMQRLSAKQAGIRERAEQVARRLDAAGLSSRRVIGSIQLMKSVENDLRDLRYDDAARKRRVALGDLKSALTGLDQTIAVQLGRARELPPQLREELLQSADEGYPEGYESLLKSYFRALSKAEK